ncbi:DnaD domain protein [Exiguobacterium antarcticum]|uniref:DnaD domain protein n=1 Tax=Exiguobacterium antarcticum TaxID=132920 RepID=A0ABT6R032_9BACL|nr:DnaD domain protein [Exiguobacterium antarcticum]MDI3234205.1 DnaD domain protein [Exiguobacterium antarcticum]
MSIIRIKKEDNYIVLDKTLLKDKELSWKAKGLHSYLMGLPDDWKVQEADLVNRSSDGRASTRSAIKELTDAGYIKRVAVREKGKFKAWEFVVHERPVFDVESKGEQKEEQKPVDTPEQQQPDVPESENLNVVPPECDFPIVEKPIVENRTLLSNKGTKEPKELKKEVVVDAGAKQDATTELIEFYKQNIEPLAPPFTIEKILDDIESHGVELVRFAIETAILSNVRKYAYISGILTTWAQAGIKTVEQARHQANEFRERQRTRGGKRTGGSSGMKTPAWVAKEKEDQQAFEEKRKAETAAAVPDAAELDAILNELKALE